MIAGVACDVLWLWESMNRVQGVRICLFRGRPEWVSGGNGKEDECYAGPVG